MLVAEPVPLKRLFLLPSFVFFSSSAFFFSTTSIFFLSTPYDSFTRFITLSENCDDTFYFFFLTLSLRDPQEAYQPCVSNDCTFAGYHLVASSPFPVSSRPTLCKHSLLHPFICVKNEICGALQT